ncbi:tripartite tricarboxylate transporter substrate binding protein [Bordetella genomosp. 13]|uniref:tripartite tricarboxylate transporter substrate binding protein n=1 Tax=Bordetella genomosp. 13 TaxID=463040 RepID=UPI0011A797BA|nr:tripartite tricarboxylate transporter substrate binding protein [Bordetella genomosp. 13]
MRKPLLSIAAALAALALNVQAAGWPDKPIRMIVPYPPGGATDVAARLYAQQMGDELKQPVVVENKAGAGGEVGAEAVARAEADGYTVMMGALGSLAINASLLDKQNYSFARDFKGVSVAITMPMALAVSTNIPAKSVPELIALAKQRAGKLTIGSAGNGSSQHMAGELFKQMTGTDILHVPYRGSGPAVTDLLGGQIDMVIETLPALMPHVASGKIRILGVTSAQRAPMLPDVPTFAEQGVRGYSVATTYALLAPTGTPAGAIDKMSAAMRKAGASAQVKDGAAKLGATATPTTPAQTDKVIATEIETWGDVVRRSARR